MKNLGNQPDMTNNHQLMQKTKGGCHDQTEATTNRPAHLRLKSGRAYNHIR